jgi:hypothetical protein
MQDTVAGRRYDVLNPRTLKAAGLITGQDDTGEWRRWNDHLIDMLALKDGWDGEEAKAPTRELILSILDFLNQLRIAKILPPPSRMVAGPEGEIILEWQNHQGEHVELEAARPYEGEWMFERDGKYDFRPYFWSRSLKVEASTIWQAYS